MNKTNHVLTGIEQYREQLKDERKVRIDKIAKTILPNYSKGFTVKDVAVDANINGSTAKMYVYELYSEGRIQRIGKEGHSYIYILSDLLTDKQEEAAKVEDEKQEEAAKEEPQKVCAGREFENPRSVTSVVAGDISWISSRSGNGLFFRYLILIVHSYKATCVIVFPEGHEAVNINDPNFIFVGEDPESGENLYADLTNVCQRRFSAFGERCMHISPEHMENVKNRMARLLKVDIHPVGDQGIVEKLKKDNEKLSESLKTAGEQYQKLSVDYASYREGVNNQFKGIIHEKKEADKANDELQAKLNTALDLYEKSRKAYFELEEEYKRYVAAHPDKPSDEPKEETGLFDDIRNDNAILGMIIDGKTKEAQIKLLEKQNEQLYNLLDNLSLNLRKEAI